MKPARFRAATTWLLVFLTVGAIALPGFVSFRILRQQNVALQDQVAQVAGALDAAERHLERADAIARRTLRLEAERLRLSILTELCVVFRLERQDVGKCRDVRHSTARLVRVIREFRERVRDSPVAAGGSATPGSTPPAGTKTITVAPPPDTVGESDNCPPNNPHCQGG